MNRFSSSFVTSFAELLTISIIHFVWQAVVLALLLVVVLKLWNVRSAHNRYVLSVSALLLMSMAPVVTAIWHQSVSQRQPMAATELVAAESVTRGAVSVNSTSQPDVALPAHEAPPITSSTVRFEVYVLIAWLIGVCVLSLRLALGFGIGLWIRAKVQPLSADLQQRVQVLGEKLAVSVEWRVFECARVGQAVAMGFLRPIVLIPAAWFTQLSPQTIEAIIAHELAHIRRWDLHVNLMQRIIETLLFYHPAVWWLSERIRIEREMCCDEIAAELFDRTMYARSLESVATISHRNLLLATSIGGGRKMKLLNRIGYLLRITPADTTGNGWTFGLLAVVLPLAAIMAFTYSAAAKPPAAKHVGSKAVDAIIVAKVQPKTVTLIEQYVGRISSHRHIQIRALTKGSIDEFLVKEGQRVKQGDMLFRVQPAMYQARLDAESAEAKIAQLEYNNTKKLFENKVTSVNELALQEAKLAKAMAKVKLAAAELETTIVKAPFDGIIDRLQQQKGSSVVEGDVVATLSDNSIVQVSFNVDESRYLEFVADGERKEDLQLQLTLANGKAFDQIGRISSIESDFNYEQGTIGFRADFPNPSGFLRHGQTGTVRLNRQLKNAIVVPQHATFSIANKQYVYSVDKDQVAHLREITVQQELNDSFVVKSGLVADEKIVIEGLRQIVDGGKVVGEGDSPSGNNSR